MATSQLKGFQKELDKGNVTLKNSLARIERTFLPVGTKIGKYQIIEEIDRGGMAVVYKATQLDLDRVVALKIMPANISITPGFLERFLSEAHSVAKLSHGNIVTIHEVSMESNIYYIAMDYIPGKNLFYYLNQNKPKVLEVLEIVTKLADALAYAHNQKIIHRDLKLNNVIMRDRHTPILIDFGLAKALETEDANITRTGEIVGSPAYMAPERLMGGKVDHRSDVCSLGIMLYEMLTFKNPYLDQRSLHQTALNVMESAPIPPRKLVPWLPPEIEAITLKAMNADVLKRYQSMEEFRDDLTRYQKGEPVLAQPPSLRSRVRRFLKKYWPYLTISLVAIAFSVLFAVSFYIQREKGKSHWQLAFQEKFSGKELDANWRIAKSDTSDTAGWHVYEGNLIVTGGKPSHVRIEQPFTRDIRVEFDVEALTEDFYDVGAFLYGDRPDSGYAFRIHHGGTNENGLASPASDFLLYDNAPFEFPTARRYHVEIERKQSQISFRLNGVTIVKRNDYFPKLGLHHQNIGFFTRGGQARFDNLRVFQRAIPQSPSPTLIADRFWERGDFQAALEEYRGLHLDFGNSDITRQILTKIPDCLIRMGRYQEAITEVEKLPTGRIKDDVSLPLALYLKATAFRNLGDEFRADSAFASVVTTYPASPVGEAAASAVAQYRAIQASRGSLDSAGAILTLLGQTLGRYAPDVARLHIGLMDRYAQLGLMDSSLSTARRIAEYYMKDESAVAMAHSGMGRAFLCKGKKQEAVEVLNQCIATHVLSEGVWEAWMLLAAIYELDFNFNDALTIYGKVYRECPRATLTTWMARLKMGEIAKKAGANETAESIFATVVTADHPFPLPRMVAQYYRGNITENQMIQRWKSMYPKDKYYLYYFARKALLKNEKVVAKVYLQELIQSVPPGTLRFVLANHLIHNLDKW
jgi:serine/threonine protein kinase